MFVSYMSVLFPLCHLYLPAYLGVYMCNMCSIFRFGGSIILTGREEHVASASSTIFSRAVALDQPVPVEMRKWQRKISNAISLVSYELTIFDFAIKIICFEMHASCIISIYSGTSERTQSAPTARSFYEVFVLRNTISHCLLWEIV